MEIDYRKSNFFSYFSALSDFKVSCLATVNKIASVRFGIRAIVRQKNYNSPRVRGDSLGFWILRRRFWISGTGFHSRQWNFNCGFQSLVGFLIPRAVFLIPKPRIPDSTSKNFTGFVIRIPLHRAIQLDTLYL